MKFVALLTLFCGFWLVYGEVALLSVKHLIKVKYETGVGYML